jgi:hypothetical protein
MATRPYAYITVFIPTLSPVAKDSLATGEGALVLSLDFSHPARFQLPYAVSIPPKFLLFVSQADSEAGGLFGGYLHAQCKPQSWRSHPSQAWTGLILTRQTLSAPPCTHSQFAFAVQVASSFPKGIVQDVMRAKSAAGHASTPLTAMLHADSVVFQAHNVLADAPIWQRVTRVLMLRMRNIFTILFTKEN